MVVEDENSTAVDLEDIIKRDQSIASRIVSVANAPFYGRQRKVESISQAIFLLGFDMVKSLAISVAVFSNIIYKGRYDIRALWNHSFNVAIASSLIAEKTGRAGMDSAFLAGLLHDIGRAILLQIFGDAYFDVSASGPEGLLEREEVAFGAPHTLTGAWFADKNKLPESCVKSINFHHEPERCLPDKPGDKCRALAQIIHIADVLVTTDNKGYEHDCLPSPEYDGILKTTGLKEEDIAEIQKRLDSMKEEVRNFYFL